VRARDVLGRRVLIVGESGTGKTALLARLLEELVEEGLAEGVTLIEMAPPRVGRFGGRVSDYTGAVSRVRYLFSERVYTPRLSGRTAQEVEELARRNAELLRPLLLRYIESPTPILLINDVTMYLHAGEPELLLRALSLSETFVGTAYEGRLLEDDKGSGVTRREREGLELLKRAVDLVVRLG